MNEGVILNSSSNKPRIRLIGDHSAYHCGSAAAFETILASCRKAGRVVLEGEEYDILIVNGEGSMHHDSPTCRKKLSEIKAAGDLGKRVQLINTVWQGNAPSSADVLACCDKVISREVLSQQELLRSGIQSEVLIDQSYFLPIDENATTKSFNKNMVLTDLFSRDLGTFAKVTTQWTWDVPYIQMHEWTWSSLVISLRSANVLVTGRHHAVYAACRARIPFLALKGNTHKIEGLIASAGVDIPIFDTYNELRKALRSKDWQKYDYDALFDWMDGQQVWTLT